MQVQGTPLVYTVVPVSTISLSDEENSCFSAITAKFVNRTLSSIYDTKAKKEFIPFLNNKVSQIMLKWFVKLRGSSSFTKDVATGCLCNNEKTYLENVAKRVFKIAISFKWWDKYTGPTEILGNDIKIKRMYEGTQMHYNISLSWFPDNKFLYAFPKPLSNQIGHESFFRTELNYLKGDTNQDFILIAEGQSIRVHKHKLAAHSEYFAQLFKSDFKEIKMGQALVPNSQYKIVDALVVYIYTGRTLPDVTSEIESLKDLTELAHMYQVKSLVEICEADLCVYLKGHFGKVFELALRLDLDRLIKYCVDFSECKKDGGFIHSVTRDNFAKLYTIAYESNFTYIQQELDNCRKYNPAFKGIDIQIKK